MPVPTAPDGSVPDGPVPDPSGAGPSGPGPSGAESIGSDLISPESISAVTLAVADMARSVAFYEALGFQRLYGGPRDRFTSYAVGTGYLNLTTESAAAGWWGRLILYVPDVDVFHASAVAAGLQPMFAPRDAPWGERYFHLRDPDGHELSFARPLGH